MIKLLVKHCIEGKSVQNFKTLTVCKTWAVDPINNAYQKFISTFSAPQTIWASAQDFNTHRNDKQQPRPGQICVCMQTHQSFFCLDI